MSSRPPRRVLSLGARSAGGVAGRAVGCGHRTQLPLRGPRVEPRELRGRLRHRRVSAPTILHLDLDAFYASVEQRETAGAARPAGHRRRAGRSGRRGRGELRGARVRRLQRDADAASTACVPRRRVRLAALRLYAEVSKEVMAILRFRDAARRAALARRGISRRRRCPAAARIRTRDRRNGCGHGSGRSWGSPRRSGSPATKMLAKIASDLAKPDGMLVIDAGTELEFLHPAPRPPAVGGRSGDPDPAHRIGVETVGDLAAIPEATLVRTLGSAAGRHLHALAWNRDPRPVEPHQEAKSIGHEETFARRPDRPSRAGAGCGADGRPGRGAAARAPARSRGRCSSRSATRTSRRSPARTPSRHRPTSAA